MEVGKEYIEDIIERSYGDRVDLTSKGKILNKFGLNETVNGTWETVAEFQGSVVNETYVNTNIIDQISSSSASDNGKAFTIEGHTIDGEGNLYFAVQTVTLDGADGRTPVALSTPLARATRMYLAASGVFDSPQVEPVGTIYVYDNTDGHTLGVPNTAAATKILLVPGEAQSEKCATTISYEDYWIIDMFGCAIGNSGGSAAYVTVQMEYRDIKNGGVWRPLGRVYTLWADQPGITLEYTVPEIVPPNHDWRVRARTNANTAQVYAEARGFLAVAYTR